ncbi:MAG: WD40 repeat domain-containing protein [bacterium]|jgi:hypothetical protein
MCILFRELLFTISTLCLCLTVSTFGIESDVSTGKILPQQPRLELIHDAVFSPDGKYIGIGTQEGFLLYEREGMRLVYFLDMPGEVYFLKWSPNSARVLLAHWPGNPLGLFEGMDIPSYSILDIKAKKIISTFQESVRWNITHTVGLQYHTEDGSTEFLWDSIYPSSFMISHPNALVFSPDGQEIALITQENRIRFYDVETGKMKQEIRHDLDHHLISVGYSAGNQEIWTGTLRSIVLYWNRETGLMTNSLLLKFMSENDQLGVVKAYALSENQTSFLALTAFKDLRYEVAGNLNKYNAQSGQLIDVKAIGNGYFPRHRASFISDSDLVIALISYTDGDNLFKHDSYYHLEYYYDPVLTRIRTFYEYGLPNVRRFLAQPFARDGSEFLLLEDTWLYIVNAETLEFETFTIQPSAVEEFQVYE